MAYPSIMLVAKLDFAGTSPERDMPPQAFRSRRSFYADYLASDHWRPKYQPPITVPPLPALPRRKQARRAKLDQYRATERRHRISAEAKPGNSHFIIFPGSVLFSRGRLDPDQHPKHASAQDVGHLSTAHDAGMRMTSPTASRSASPDLPKATP